MISRNDTCGQIMTTYCYEWSWSVLLCAWAPSPSLYVRYKKFLQCKDLSCKTEEDLNCIFGRKKQRQKQRQEPPDAGSISIDSSTDPTEEPLISHGIPTITRKLSVQDYFSAKRLEIANRKKEQGPEESVNVSSGVEGTCIDVGLNDAERCTKRKRRRAKPNIEL